MANKTTFCLVVVIISAILLVMPSTANIVNADSSRTNTAPGHEGTTGNFGQCNETLKGTIGSYQAHHYCGSIFGAQGIGQGKGLGGP